MELTMKMMDIIAQVLIAFAIATLLVMIALAIFAPEKFHTPDERSSESGHTLIKEASELQSLGTGVYGLIERGQRGRSRRSTTVMTRRPRPSARSRSRRAQRRSSNRRTDETKKLCFFRFGGAAFSMFFIPISNSEPRHLAQSF